MKWDRKDTLISSGVGLALIVLSYLVWRHEQNITNASAAANNAQAAAQDQQSQAEMAAILQQELQASVAGNEYGGGGGFSTPIAAPSVSSDIPGILAAFGYGQPTSGGNASPQPPASSGGTASAPPSTSTPSSTTAPLSPVLTPVPPQGPQPNPVTGVRLPLRQVGIGSLAGKLTVN